MGICEHICVSESLYATMCSSTSPFQDGCFETALPSSLYGGTKREVLLQLGRKAIEERPFGVGDMMENEEKLAGRTTLSAD
ncbi:hypothetical protein Y1Q_0010139 [Alligator mississippiensis]|uniref:Uncharacterized protein n=1 Tax=Alligator mississippiensis TaxID=8496 RepID=A0A151NFW0_ALLMI|nr:hypothetical protein Y1Q_0010139 [Alligator mississippiensis]